MAWTQSFIPSATFRDVLNGTLSPNFSSDIFKVALYDNSITATMDDDPNTYGSAKWATEVTGTNWPAGGVALSAVTTPIALVAGNGIKFDANDINVASTTISTAAFGCLIYDSTLTAKNGWVAVEFGSGYTTNNGTFGITWNASGIFTVKLF